MRRGYWLRQRIIAALMWGYKLLNAAHLLDGPVARRLFTYVYFAGKRHLEDDLFRFLECYPAALANGHLLDVGANIGYTALVLARRLTPGFRVVAFEPERTNVAILRSTLGRHASNVDVQIEAVAVGDRDGLVELWHNPDHHADHRISMTALDRSHGSDSRCYSVPQVTLDSFVARENLDPVRLVKIDVQGYELMVLQGMRRLIDRTQPLIIAIEYAPQLLQELGFRPASVLDFLRERGFHTYTLNGRGTIERFVESTDERLVPDHGYVDLICCRQIADLGARNDPSN